MLYHPDLNPAAHTLTWLRDRNGPRRPFIAPPAGLVSVAVLRPAPAGPYTAAYRAVCDTPTPFFTYR